MEEARAPLAKKKKPDNSPFKQQNLKQFQPLYTPQAVISTLLFCGTLFLAVGIPTLIASRGTFEKAIQYDPAPATFDCPGQASLEPCALNQTCYVCFRNEEVLKAPVFIYYQLDKFYQNYRTYISSRSDGQLMGSASGDLSQCSGYYDVKGGKCDPNLPNQPGCIVPCGLVANSVFNDTFALRAQSITGQTIFLRESGIAWSSDVSNKFQNPEKCRNPLTNAFETDPSKRSPECTRDLKDEHFIVWMRVAGLPKFKKLWAVIDTDLPPGEYYFQIRNNFPTRGFGGTKWIVVATTSWLGGRNDTVGITYIVVGCVAIVLALIFLAKERVYPKARSDAARGDGMRPVEPRM
eukprot:tig00000448_g860.t1